MKLIRHLIRRIATLFILSLSSMAVAQENVNDGHTYAADAETGITCKSKWIIDRIHTPEKFLSLPFVAEAGPKARTAVMDGKRGKIYIGYSKPVVVDSVSNDYAHLVVFDLETGAYEKEITLTCDGAPISGLLCANQVGIDDAGNLWICGMYSNVCETPAQIYVVTNRETGECKNVGQWALPTEESGAGGRCDFWDVVGDITGETSNAVCMAAVGATVAGEKCCIYRWELPQGETEWVANEDYFAGYVSYDDGLDTYPADQATWGSSGATVRIVAEEGHVGSMFYVDGFNTCPSLYNTSFEMVKSFASAPDLAPSVGCNGVNEFVLGETPFLVYAEAQYNVSPGCRINVCQLGEGMTFEGMRKYWSLPEAGLGEVSDGGTRIHSIDTHKVVDKNGKEGIYLLTYKNVNGIGLYLIAEDGFDEKEIDKIIDDGTGSIINNDTIINGITYSIIKGSQNVCVRNCDKTISGAITIPNSINFNGLTYSVTEISNSAFWNCKNLTSISIPNTISSIGYMAFYACTGLKTFISLGTIPPNATNAFNSYSPTLYVPKDSFAKYFIDDVWGNFSNIAKIETFVSSISLNKTSINLDEGAKTSLSATIKPSNATIKNIEWKSSNPQVAIVNQDGTITALSVGKTSITATTTDGTNLSASCNVNVNSIKTKITLSSSEADLLVNDIMKLTYNVTPLNTPVEWSTSDANIAYIKKNADNSVTVLGLTHGTATITATALDNSGAYASCIVHVGPYISIPSSSISMNTIIGTSCSKYIYISGVDLSANIVALLSGDAAFSIDNTSLGSSGGTIKVTFKPTAVGNHSATLTLSSTGATTKTIQLKGTTETIPTGLTKVWQNTSSVPGTAAGGDVRFAAVSNGKLIATDKANNKIIEITESGYSDYADPSAALAEYYNQTITTAIGCDDVGNILVSTGFTSASSGQNFAIISADLKSTYKIDLSTIEGYIPKRTDQLGRIRGNMLSNEGGYAFIVPNGGTSVLVLKIKNGAVDTEYTQVTNPIAGVTLNTSACPQPAFATVAEIDALMDENGDLSNAFIMRSRGVPSSVFAWNDGNTDMVKAWTFSAADGNCTTANASVEGFDWFTLKDKKYFVLPVTTDGTTGTRGSNIAIFDEEGTCVATWTEGQKAGLGAAMGSIIVVPNNDFSVFIYHFVPGTVAEKLCFALEPPHTNIENIIDEEYNQNTPIEYYNLQGIKVSKPTKGIFIKVQDKKATKVIIK